MDYIIREIKKAEYDLLNDFLYEAIYIPDGVEPPPKSIINCPELQEYVFDEYSCAVTPQIRQTGNRLSGNAGTAYASLLA